MKRKSDYKLIFNPNAGKKRKFFGTKRALTLEEVRFYLDKYEIKTDFFPSKSAAHARKLAAEAKKEGYKTVLAVGGDGTSAVVASGLIGTDVVLGIIPKGSFMNLAKMLSIPLEVEKAIELIKIGRCRKVDVGKIEALGGEKITEPTYFLESLSMGIEAVLFLNFAEIEKKKRLIKSFWAILNIFHYRPYRVKVTLDGKVIESKVQIVNVSNGPLSGSNLRLSPKSKINDYFLTVSLFNINKLDILRYLYKTTIKKAAPTVKPDVYNAKSVTIETSPPRLVQADGRIFGKTPVKATSLGGALNVITGFADPKSKTDAFKKRTPLGE